MNKNINDLLQGNQAWAAGMRETHPDFFEQQAAGQAPPFLWIGCADSRVPPTQITNSVPGTIFVQRNIANMVVDTDSNLLSVAYYAVNALKVKHIIVCGHYGCGGVKAAMGDASYGLMDPWLKRIKDVMHAHQAELDAIANDDDRADRLVELNVMAQANNVAKLDFVQAAMDNDQPLTIHGWVYSLKTGLIKDLNS